MVPLTLLLVAVGTQAVATARQGGRAPSAGSAGAEPVPVAQDSDEAGEVSSQDGLDPEVLALLDLALSPVGRDLVANLAVIGFDEAGPTVSEYRVRAQAGGDLVAVTSGRWSFARTQDDVFAQVSGGPTLRLGAVADRAATAEALLQNYVVDVGPARLLDTGTAVPIVLRSRADGAQRERLWVDEQLGALVRRETYSRDGVPQRLIALTSVDVIAPRAARAVVPDDVQSSGPLVGLTAESTATLGRTGWVTPEQLPDGYRLRDGFAMGAGATSAVHLVYSDGLYTMSLYQQRGELAANQLSGAVRDEHPGMTLWRWPGAEPERLVWSDGSMTYAVVTDAPHDVVLPVIAALPHDTGMSLTERLARGLGRVMSWLNPLA